MNLILKLIQNEMKLINRSGRFYISGITIFTLFSILLFILLDKESTLESKSFLWISNIAQLISYSIIIDKYLGTDFDGSRLYYYMTFKKTTILYLILIKISLLWILQGFLIVLINFILAKIFLFENIYLIVQFLLFIQALSLSVMSLISFALSFKLKYRHNINVIILTVFSIPQLLLSSVFISLPTQDLINYYLYFFIFIFIVFTFSVKILYHILWQTIR